MKGFIIGDIVVLSCIFFSLLNTSNKDHRKTIWVLYSIILLVISSLFIYKITNAILHPGFWDFTCFYLYGKVAAGGHNFYLADNFHNIANSLNLPEILNQTNSEYVQFASTFAGFPYPPPTILYFAPLGYLSFKIGLLLWCLFISFFAFASIYLIYLFYFKEYKLKGIIFVAILVFILPESKATVFYTQTNFILLFLLLLIKKYSDKKVSGIFLALAIFTKPYMIILLFYFLFKRNWNSVLYFFLSSALLIALTYMFYGGDIFISYLHDNPVNRIPKDAFFETINQSLQSILLRQNLITFGRPFPYILISSVILLLAGIFTLYLLKKRLYDNILAVLLLIGLMLYPGTLSHYGVVLLFILFSFFDKKSSYFFHGYFLFFIVGLFYFLMSYSLFLTICFLLILIIHKSLTKIPEMKNQ